MIEIEEQSTEKVLLAGLVALIKIRIGNGENVLDILDELAADFPTIQSDVVEGLARLKLI